MIVSLMTRCAALYFARQNIAPAGPAEIGEALLDELFDFRGAELREFAVDSRRARQDVA